VLAPERGLRSQLRYATSLAASHAVIIGDDELERGVVVVRDLGKGEQREVPMDELSTAFGTKRD
jgi:histidyl-tRNA synthetase